MLSPIAVTMGLPSSKDNTVTRGRLDHAKVKHTVPYRRYCRQALFRPVGTAQDISDCERGTRNLSAEYSGASAGDHLIYSPLVSLCETIYSVWRTNSETAKLLHCLRGRKPQARAGNHGLDPCSAETSSVR